MSDHLPSRPVMASFVAGVLATTVLSGQTPAEREAAVLAIAAFQLACAQDDGSTWGLSLCGPLIAVDGQSGLAVATAKPPLGSFEPRGALWVGKVPEGMQVANTATEWEGTLWSTVRLPLPTDRYLRDKLLAHEAFHRVQGELGLNASDAINGHLDERDGRLLLRLELRALTAALTSTGAASRDAVRDAVLFRDRRQQLYPGADTLESLLEVQEGLAEYTGARLALATAPDTARLLREATAEFETRPTFVRSLGYGTGPLLGLLLDRLRPGWQQEVRARGFATQLREAIGYRRPAELAAAVQQAGARHGWQELVATEDSRAAERTARLADYTGRLVEGPVLVLRADQLYRSFNPNTLMAMGNEGTVYPTGSFSADWGALTVESGGALLRPSNREVRVSIVDLVREGASKLSGSGWSFELREGWRIVGGDREGDLTVTQVER